MGYKTTSAERSQASSAVSSAIAAFNNPDGSGFALTSTALTADKELKQYTVVAGTDPISSETTIGGSGSIITNVIITDSSYNVVDDTAVSTAGGYIKVIGTGFLIGCVVYTQGTAATTTTFVSATEVRAELPSNSSGTLLLYLVNPDNSAAIYLSGVVFSGVPAWSTDATLTAAYEQVSYSQALIATGDATVSYSLKSGSTLPDGVTLNPTTGVLSGTTPVIASGSTTYTFTIIATDGQNQDTERLFSLTVNHDVVTWVSPADNTTYSLSVDEAISNVELSATSASGKTVSYGANSLPTGLSISGANVAGTPTVTGTTSSLITATAANTSATSTIVINWSVLLTIDPFFKYNSLLLAGNGTNGANNNTFVDRSTNAGTVTPTGTPNQGTFSPYHLTGWSVYFDGTGDWLTIADNANLRMGTEDFTIEGWFQLEVVGTARGLVSKGTGTTGLAVSITAGNRLQMSTTTTNQAGTTNLISGKWYHFAMVRSGTATGNIKLYLNGVLEATSATAINTDFNQTSILYIGADRVATSPMIGNISNVRLVKGTAVYTAAFTPPDSALTAITNTQLLTCHLNRIVDSSTNAFLITRVADARVTAVGLFAPGVVYDPTLHGGSAYFRPSNNIAGGDQLAVPVAAAAFGTGDFTIELWSYIDSNGFVNGGALFEFTGANGTFVLRPENNTYWRVTTLGGQINYTTGGSSFLNQWMHHAVVRNAGTVYYYQNGVLRGSIADGTNYAPTTFKVSNYAQYGAGGHISDFRVVLGTAVYTADFTPPVSALTAITNTSLLLSFTNAGIVDATAKNNFLITGQVSVSTTAPKFGTGSIYFGSTAQVNKLVGSFNTDTGNFGTNDFTVEYWFKSVAGRNVGDYVVWMTTTGSYTLTGANAAGNWAIVGSGALLYWQSQYASDSTLSTSSTAILDNNWHHIAFVRYNGVLSIYFDGVSQASIAHTLNYARPIASTKLAMGGPTTSGSAAYGTVNAYIDDLRITRGYARYTAAFTPPIEHYVR